MKKRSLTMLLLLLSAFLPVTAQADAPITDEYIVVLSATEVAAPWETPGAKPSVSALAASLVAASGGSVLRTWEWTLPAFLATLTSGELDALEKRSEVAYIEPNFRIDHPFGEVPTPAGPLSSGVGGFTCLTIFGQPYPTIPTPPAPDLSGPPPWQQPIDCQDPTANCEESWGLDRIDQRLLPRDQLFDFGFFESGVPSGTGLGVHAYVFDSGIHHQHQDFAGRIGNGFNATGDANGTTDCVSNGHGSMVSGVIAGSTYGVAKGATLHPVRIGDCPGGLTQTDWLLDGVEWIATNAMQPAIVNMSLNFNSNSSIDREAFDDAVRNLILVHGIPVVNSAGNYNNQAQFCSPTRVDEVIVVGATQVTPAGGEGRWVRFPGNTNHQNGYGSNYGPELDLWAPGTDVISASHLDPHGGCKLPFGTSFSAPLTTGVAAVLLEQAPNLSPADLELYLRLLATCHVLESSPADDYWIEAGSPNLLLYNPKLPLSVIRLPSTPCWPTGP